VGRVRSENSESRLLIDEPPLMTLKLGISKLAAWNGPHDVTLSSRWLLLQSTKGVMEQEVGSDEGMGDAGRHKLPHELSEQS
jgi:hypothetical protein